MRATSTRSDASGGGDSAALERARGAAAAYGAASLLLGRPRAGLYEALAQGELFATLLSASADLEATERLETAVTDLASAWVSEGYLAAADLDAGFHRVFGHAQSPDFPPYETEYGAGGSHRQTQCLADLAGFYRAFGLMPDENAHERPDHLAMEMEFMAFLAAKEAYAIGEGDTALVEHARGAQDRLLAQHLGPVMPVFARLASRHARGKFYPAACAFADRLVAWDVGRRRLVVTPVGGLALARGAGPDAACESGCEDSCESGREDGGDVDAVSETGCDSGSGTRCGCASNQE